MRRRNGGRRSSRLIRALLPADFSERRQLQSQKRSTTFSAASACVSVTTSASGTSEAAYRRDRTPPHLFELGTENRRSSWAGPAKVSRDVCVAFCATGSRQLTSISVNRRHPRNSPSQIARSRTEASAVPATARTAPAFPARHPRSPATRTGTSRDCADRPPRDGPTAT
jgi:hypothetical protein